MLSSKFQVASCGRDRGIAICADFNLTNARPEAAPVNYWLATLWGKRLIDDRLQQDCRADQDSVGQPAAMSGAFEVMNRLEQIIDVAWAIVYCGDTIGTVMRLQIEPKSRS